MTSLVRFPAKLDEHVHCNTSRQQTINCSCVSRGRLFVLLIVSMLSTMFLLTRCFIPGSFVDVGHVTTTRLHNCPLSAAIFLTNRSQQQQQQQQQAVTRQTVRHNDVIFNNATRTHCDVTNKSAVASQSDEDYYDFKDDEYTDDDAEVTSSSDEFRRLPQCLIIGVRKGGTRALLEFLNLHPAVHAVRQEVHFFDNDRRYGHGLEWYRRRMRSTVTGQLTIEKTPAYFVVGRVPFRVRQMNSSVRLLLTVRDPVERVISDYLQIHEQRTAKGKYHPSFAELSLDPETGEVDRTYRAITRSLYDRHMVRWLRHFDLSQFHFVHGENLVRDPVAELSKVEAFLGLDHQLDKDKFYYNKTRGFYCMRLNTRRADLQTDGNTTEQIRCLSSSKGRTHPEIDSKVIEKLRQFYKPHNERFYKMVGIDFGWR